MRFGKGILCLLSAAILAGALLFAGNNAAAERQEEADREAAVVLSIEIRQDDGSEQIHCWRSETGEYYLFLPGGARMSQVSISRIWVPGEVRLNGVLLTEGMSCQTFRPDEAYELTVCLEDGTETGRLTFLSGADVPAMYIDVRSGSMDYIHRQVGNLESGSMRLYDGTGERNWSGQLRSIQGRGYSSWGADKKPYSLELQTSADLLGMGRAESWILLANAYDPTNLRNKLVYEFAQEAGLAYTPQCRWVDLHLNGEYAGLYLLCERIEVHPQRVAIGESGSFLVSKSSQWRLDSRNRTYVMTQGQTALRLHYADMPLDDVQRTLQSVENALTAEDGIDPVTGKSYGQLIDADSWARKYLVEEIFGNIDGGTLSQYFYLDGSDGTGKVYAGPVWDFDLSMGKSVSWPSDAPNMFFANRPGNWDTSWFHGIYQKEDFRRLVERLYEEEFRPLAERLLETGLDRYRDAIGPAAERNRLRWDEDDPAQATEQIRSYLTARLDFLDSVWLEDETYCTLQINALEGEVICYALKPGEVPPEFPEFADTDTTIYEGWYTLDTDEPYDPAQPVYEDTVIYLKTVPRERELEAGEALLLRLFRGALMGVFCLIFAAAILADVRRRRREKTKPRTVPSGAETD